MCPAIEHLAVPIPKISQILGLNVCNVCLILFGENNDGGTDEVGGQRVGMGTTIMGMG